MKIMQLDIFGNEVPFETIINQTKKRTKSIKVRFREVNGTNDKYKCRDCIHFIKCRMNTTTFYKCEEIGITPSKATDINASDIACNLYDEEVEVK